MKKTFHASMIYMILALVCGVFYREYTKFMAFQGTTTLAFTHVHLFVLGTILFLVLTLFCIQTDLEKEKGFQRFMLIYNIALPFMIVMLIVRGIVQVNEIALSSSMNAMISGIAGVSHILLTIGLAYLFIGLKHTLDHIKK